MDWHALAQDVWHFFRSHWASALYSLAFLIVGTWWGRRRARREWANKRFLDRLNFSLNTIGGGTLQIRTLAEMNARDVFLNDVAVERVIDATRRTTATNPLLPLARDDRWYYLNAVLNEVSERFAVGFIKRDMGVPVETRSYLICLTYEIAGDLKTRKVRAMVIQKSTLTNLPVEPPRFERPHHATRFETLRHLAAAYASDPTEFLDVELSI